MAKKEIIKANAIHMVGQKKIPYIEYEYERDGNHLSASSVAEQLPENQSRIFKILVAVGNMTEPLVAVIPGGAELNLKKLAKASGNKKVEMFYLKDLEAATGYIRGGCSPIGTKKLSPAHLDQIAGSYEQITASADRRGPQTELAPQDICALMSGQFVDIKQ